MRKFAFVAAAAAAIVTLTAGPASAALTPYYMYYGGVYRAYGEFESYGDRFVVCDMNSDGRGAYLQFHVPSTGRYDGVYDTNGYNQTCGSLNTNIGEGRYVQFRICLTDSGSVLWSTCDYWQGATA